MPFPSLPLPENSVFSSREGNRPGPPPRKLHFFLPGSGIRRRQEEKILFFSSPRAEAEEVGLDGILFLHRKVKLDQRAKQGPSLFPFVPRIVSGYALSFLQKRKQRGER